MTVRVYEPAPYFSGNPEPEPTPVDYPAAARIDVHDGVLSLGPTSGYGTVAAYAQGRWVAAERIASADVLGEVASLITEHSEDAEGEHLAEVLAAAGLLVFDLPAEEEEAERATADRAVEPLDGQVARLAGWIVEHVPGEPSRSEGAIDTALRLLGQIEWHARVGSPARSVLPDPEPAAPPLSVADLTDGTVAPELLAALHDLGDRYGPLGVALAAAAETDPAVLVARLTTPAGSPAAPPEETPGDKAARLDAEPLVLFDREPDDLPAAITEALGAASVQWSESGHGIFLGRRALAIAEQLQAWIDKRYAPRGATEPPLAEAEQVELHFGAHPRRELPVAGPGLVVCDGRTLGVTYDPPASGVASSALVETDLPVGALQIGDALAVRDTEGETWTATIGAISTSRDGRQLVVVADVAP